MKIALVAEHLSTELAPGAGPYPGDPALRVLALARTLGALGQSVTVYCRQDAAGQDDAERVTRTELCSGVTVEPVPAPRRPGRGGDAMVPDIALFADHLAARWRRDAPDVVHAHWWSSGLIALAAARDLSVPVVQTFQSLGSGPRGADGPQPPCGCARVRLEAAIGRCADVVLAGNADEAAALGRLGVPQSSVRIVPSGVDTEHFRPAGKAAERDRPPRLLVVAPPAEPQAVAPVIRALALVPEAELLLAGGDGAHPALAQLAARLKAAHRVSCTGPASLAAMPPIMRSADALVTFTTADGFAMVPLEAMACGLPVLAALAVPHLVADQVRSSFQSH
ncbi:MAG: glycosyltransferase [Streptosporangiaceae bacterium]